MKERQDMADGAIKSEDPTPFSFLLADGEELTLETAVYQALGGASVCWFGGTGHREFNSIRAKEIAEYLIAAIKELLPLPADVIRKADELGQRRQAQIANQKAAIDRLMSQQDVRSEELITAIRLTAEYLGRDTLPAIPGWSWYDALLKYAPAVAAQFRQPS